MTEAKVALRVGGEASGPIYLASARALLVAIQERGVTRSGEAEAVLNTLCVALHAHTLALAAGILQLLV